MAASAGKRFRKLAGSDRMTLYTVAAYTGFRASELASLTPSSFALGTTPPTLTVEAGYSKHRRKDPADALSRLSVPSVGSGKGVAPGVADKGERGEMPGRDEEPIAQARTGSHGRHDTKKTLHEHGFDSNRGSVKTSEQAEGEGFEPTAGTGPTPVFKTGATSSETLDLQALSHFDSLPHSTGAAGVSNPATTYVDLARVVELWPVLPPAIRAAILTLANTTAPTIPNGPPAADEHLDRLPPGYERSGG